MKLQDWDLDFDICMELQNMEVTKMFTKVLSVFLLPHWEMKNLLETY